MSHDPVENISIVKVDLSGVTEAVDMVTVEEPLEIQLAYSTSTGRMQKNIAVTMRTPGNDQELAAGFLFTEGVIKDAASIVEIKEVPGDNRVLVILRENIIPVLHNTARNFYSTSSCGICGKASIEAIRTDPAYVQEPGHISIPPGIFYQLQDHLKTKQRVFSHTGGIHASAMFNLEGNFIMIREDVGRHNALDKLIGALLLEQKLPLNNCILFLSGRASFELVQKAAMAGIKVIAAVGAPSSLAVELAVEAGITLLGFLRDDRFNVYAGKWRVGC